jgi:3'-phosphoadenosine 5'-phosphosulfate sulfotransferase (PAPS reductase)/FAD synthetase
MKDYEWQLLDRLDKIKSINEQYDLESNAYISFSGGKDSTVLHHLIDMALPGNKIPRVFINTGIEYNDIVSFVKEMSLNDSRFVILKPTKNIKNMLILIT